MPNTHKLPPLRAAAAHTLAAIMRGKTLEQATRRLDKYPPRDRNFARAMILTCLRRHAEIDMLIAQHMHKALPRKAEITRALLQIGTAQFAFMGIAPHAAINETINGLPRIYAHHRGLLNAVLRKITFQTTPPNAQANINPTIYAKWIADFDESTARILAEAHMHPPPLDIYFKSPTLCTAWHTQYGAQTQSRRLTAHTIRLPQSSDITKIADYEQGTWWIQDVAASLAVHLWDNLPTRVLDLCAAPGGKTLQLAAMGAEVHACDISESRLARLRDNLTRCALSAQIHIADISDWQPPHCFTHILLDAPCSASGTMRRNPDILHHYAASGAYNKAVYTLQEAMLARAADFLTPDGMLIYCVCSLDKTEGAERIARFLQSRSDFICAPITADQLDSIFVPALVDGMVQTTPALANDIGGMDGFFIARLVRTTYRTA